MFKALFCILAVLKLGQGQESGRSGEGLKKVKNAI